MKKNYFYAIMVMIVSVFFSGCEKEKNSSNPGIPDPGLDNKYVTVMKFKEPEYKNYVLASKFPQDSWFEVLRGNACLEPIGNAEYSPYWELSDNWLLVDWKWLHFPYLSGGGIILSEQSWDKVEWTDVTIGSPTWPLTEPYIEDPIEKLIYIKVENLEQYRNESYDKQILNAIALSHVFVDEYYNLNICDMSEQMDSTWIVLQKDLSTVIENGDLEHINDDKYQPTH